MTDQILVDTSDKIEVDIYYSNVLTDPSSISIREIRDPNGNVILTNQVVTKGSTTGRYEYTVDSAYTSVLGIYTAIWRFVINNTTYEHTQHYEVVSSLRKGYVTPHEVREMSVYEEITDDSPADAVLQKYIDRTIANSINELDTYKVELKGDSESIIKLNLFVDGKKKLKAKKYIND